MTVIFLGDAYNCEKAVKKDNQAVLHLTEGGTVEFTGISNWDAFTLEGGAWSYPDIDPSEQLRADVDFLAAMVGVTL